MELRGAENDAESLRLATVGGAADGVEGSGWVTLFTLMPGFLPAPRRSSVSARSPARVGLNAELWPCENRLMDYPIEPVSFTAVRVTGGFWQERQAQNLRVTLPFALSQCEQSGRLGNFDLAAEVMRRRSAGEPELQIKPPTIYPFDDTDAYKVIEAASYTLSVHADPLLERTLDAWIARIAAAQEPDGYLFTFRTMHPDSPGHGWVGSERWIADPVLSHELYNSGHLYEAGVAHFAATGRRGLLDVCLKNAELLWREFADGSKRIAPGHPIVELGLAKLYRATHDARWLKLARIFLEVRGPGGATYNQQHARVVDQSEAVGHAVRANYLYCGMADVAALSGDRDYVAAVTRLWDNVATKKLYLTGGVGALADGEAYGAEYELPDDCYSETCAAIALMMWCQRMFLFTGHGRYMDVFERAAYNGFISGVSLSGDRFFYPNPLAYDGVAKNNHGHAGRAPWFGCACCPPNVLRTLAAFTDYFYAVSGQVLYVNMYATSDATVRVGTATVRLSQRTDYPWHGQVRLAVSLDAPATFALRLRVPGWARGEPVPSDLYRYEQEHEQSAGGAYEVSVNGETLVAPLTAGYLELDRTWREGDVVELDLAMPVRRVRGHARLEAAAGARLAFERGPLVYCVEQMDVPVPLAELRVPAQAHLSAVERPELLGGVTTLRVEVPPAGAPASGLVAFECVPYFAWNNRGLAAMRVWLPMLGQP